MQETPLPTDAAPDAAAPNAAATLTVEGARSSVTLCQCSRCDHVWMPRQANASKRPAKCPHCFSPLWDKPRVYRRAGAEAPTQAPRPRGRPFAAGFDSRRDERAGDERKTDERQSD